LAHNYDPNTAIEISYLDDLSGWLNTNYSRENGVWVVSFKKAYPYYVSYGDVRDEALCFGWIDSKSQRVSDAQTATWLSPRRQGSPWSGVNKERVVELRAEGRMTPMGERAVDEAKLDGSWTILDDASALIVPTDLADDLESAASRTQFDALSPSRRRSMLEGIALAKTAKTRQKRIQKIVAECLVNQS